jgi:hypothetical protein
MSIDIQDPVIAAALQRAVNHLPPYSEEELASVRELRIVGAASLGDLPRCGTLERLEIVGSDVTDLGALSTLRELRVLRVLACPIDDARGLRGLDRLEELRLDFAFLQDAGPIFELPSLRRARLLGNPWSPESWQRLRRHGLSTSPGQAAPRPILELGADIEFNLELARRLRALGLQLSFGTLDIRREVLVRPGKARLPGHDCDWTVASGSGVWIKAGKAGATTDAVFEAIYAYYASRGENQHFDFESHREFGDRDEARRWLAAEDDAQRRALLMRFVDRFPGAVFFREDEAFQAMVERIGGIALPAGYRRARTILAGAFPERSAEFRVDRFAGNSLRMTDLSEHRIWYRAQLEDYNTDEGPVIRDIVRVYPFAAWPIRKGSILAVALDAPQDLIYEYDEWDLFDPLPRDQRPRESVFRVYSSYAELLAHIVAFKLPDGTVIDARSDDDAGEPGKD